MTAGNHEPLEIRTAIQAYPLSATTPGGYSRTLAGASDGFLARLAPDGKRVLACTLIGGSKPEELSGLDIDSAGRVYFSDNTPSAAFPVTADASQSRYGGGDSDVVVGVFSGDLRRFLFGSYFGGGGSGGYGERGRCLILAPDGAIVISGDTNSADFPATPGAIQRKLAGESDAFVLRLVARQQGGRPFPPDDR